MHNPVNIKETKDGALISIFVKPNSPEFSIAVEDGEIVVHSTEEPVKGRVNKEILKEFSRLLRVKVEIVSGATSRQKQLFAPGLSGSQVEQLLNCQGS